LLITKAFGLPIGADRMPQGGAFRAWEDAWWGTARLADGLQEDRHLEHERVSGVNQTDTTDSG
jgi:hypothetical protein